MSWMSALSRKLFSGANAAAPAAGSVDRERLRTMMLQRYNPLRDFTPAKLVRVLQQLDAGHLREYAILAERVKEQDDILCSVSAKREKQPGTRGWEIVKSDEDNPQAAAHADALQYFYDNLTVTSAIDEDEVGEVSLLLRQMMSAVGYSWAAHEIIWQRRPDGLTAELRFVPLYFFERTQGRLRFLPRENAVYGEDLEAGRWMVTRAAGVMRACLVAYLYKHMPLQDWLIYCKRHGMPGLLGKTTATYNSSEWRAMESAIADFQAEFGAVVNTADSIEPLDVSTRGALPYGPIVERMDRAMATLWRGADLSTMSAGVGQGQGASVQADETDILAADDSELLSDTLRRSLDRRVIEYRFGVSSPLAYFAVKGVTKDTVEQDLKIDQQLHTMGFPMALASLAERYGRSLPDAGEALLPSPAAPAAIPGETMLLANAAANAATPAGADQPVAAPYLAAARMGIAEAVQSDLAPLAKRLNDLVALAEGEDWNAAQFDAAVLALRMELPDLQRQMNLDPAAVLAFADAIGTLLADRVEESAAKLEQETPS